MSHYRVSISPSAAADLHSIHDYIAVHSADNAAKMVGRILAAIELLETFPHRTVLQRQSQQWEHKVRSLAVKPYVVFFWVVEDQQLVRILMIRHGARKRPNDFS
jgi:plasmid stabilization system protein ParE